jgi:hypothetical protein
MAQVQDVSVNSADPPGSVGLEGRPRTHGPAEGHGLIERVMSTVIRKLA